MNVGTNITSIFDLVSGILAFKNNTGPKHEAEAFYTAFDKAMQTLGEDEEGWQKGFRYGWITMDFPTESMIDTIINTNIFKTAFIYSGFITAGDSVPADVL